MFFYFNKKLTGTIKELSRKLRISKADIVRRGITDMATFFLDNPEEYVTFQKKEWKKALRRIELRAWKEMREEEEMYQALEKVGKGSYN